MESWIGQRYPKDDEVIEAMGMVVDLWTIESGEWRLVARHPQRADSTDSGLLVMFSTWPDAVKGRSALSQELEAAPRPGPSRQGPVGAQSR